jgi:hypothetical protein
MFAMVSMYALFMIELFATRAAYRYIAKISGKSDPISGQTSDLSTKPAPDVEESKVDPTAASGPDETWPSEAHHSHQHSVFSDSSLVGILILEAGIVFHSVFIGLTLAVAGDEFNVVRTKIPCP